MVSSDGDLENSSRETKGKTIQLSSFVSLYNVSRQCFLLTLRLAVKALGPRVVEVRPRIYRLKARADLVIWPFPSIYALE